MNDLAQEQQPIDEPGQPTRRIQLIESGDDFIGHEEDEQMEHLYTAERDTGSLGLVRLVITRYKTDDRDDEEVYVLDKNANLNVRKMREARFNNWTITVEARNPLIHIGDNPIVLNLWLINSNLAMSSKITADHAEQTERGSELSFASWKTSKDRETRDVMMPNDPDLLKRIRVNFEAMQPKLGGDTN